MYLVFLFFFFTGFLSSDLRHQGVATPPRGWWRRGRDHLRHFLANTSMHGLKYAADQESPWIERYGQLPHSITPRSLPHGCHLLGVTTPSLRGTSIESDVAFNRLVCFLLLVLLLLLSSFLNCYRGHRSTSCFSFVVGRDPLPQSPPPLKRISSLP